MKERVIIIMTFGIRIGKEITLNVSPTTPRYLGFQFSRPDVSLVKLKASSGTYNCLTISVQSPKVQMFSCEIIVSTAGIPSLLHQDSQYS
jgi:hypothetical protein